jgi:outer membrane protein OmpA-like peptidoglycan-associated protein
VTNRETTNAKKTCVEERAMTFRTRVRTFGLLGVTAASIAACASTQPPRELLDARAAYAKAASSPAAQLRPDTLNDARNTLNAAERAYASSADDADVNTISYVSIRKSELAEMQAADVQNTQEQAMADTELLKVSQAAPAPTPGEKGPADQEAMAREALDKLNTGGVTVHEEARGTVIMLPGAVLFSTGKSTLMPGAKERLNKVADVLKDYPNKKIVVEGHTDSTGKAATNDRLSQQRAESVKDYLMTRGVPSKQVTTKGFGASHPIATNTTAEGRAENRRVEIIIEPSSSGGGGGGRGGAE